MAKRDTVNKTNKTIKVSTLAGIHRIFSSSSSRSWTRLLDWCSLLEVWPHHSAPPTALAESTGEDPVQARCSRVQVSAWDQGQHRRISPMSFSRHTRLISGPGNAFDLLPHYCQMSIVHGCSPSAIGPSLLLLPAHGTVCPNMSRPYPLCLFSEVASRLSTSGVPSHDFYRNFCSACAVKVVIFGHFNRSFFTYLLTPTSFI